MKLHVESMKAIGVPAKGLLELFGLKVEDLMTLTKRGVTVSDDDIILDPGQIIPPPAIRGRLTQVAITGDRLVQMFGGGDERRVTPLKKPAPSARNYIYFGGGDIRFGKLTMTDADLQLIDADPRDPFDFFPAHLRRSARRRLLGEHAGSDLHQQGMSCCIMDDRHCPRCYVI